MSQFADGPITMTVNETNGIDQFRRVKFKSGTTSNPPECALAGAGEAGIGISLTAADNGENITIQPLAYNGTFLCYAADSFSVGASLYGAASGAVSDSSNGTAQFIAMEAATAAGDIVEMMLYPAVSTTAATVSIADAGAFTSTATVEAALQEIYQHIITAQGVIPIPMPTITAAGAALAAFSDGDSTTPGYCVTAKGLGIRWNNHGTPDPVGTKIAVPPDADVSADMTVNILAAKVGATVGDATKFTVQAFNNDVGALYDADSDFGGDTTAMTGDAATKTVQHVTLTLALANLTAYPAAIELTIQPKDGTLGTDDVILLAAWVTYTRKALTS